MEWIRNGKGKFSRNPLTFGKRFVDDIGDVILTMHLHYTNRTIKHLLTNEMMLNYNLFDSSVTYIFVTRLRAL